MRDSIRRELERAEERHAEIERMLADPDVIQDPDRFRELSQEYAHHAELVEHFQAYRETETALAEAHDLAATDDAEMQELAKTEIERLEGRLAELETTLQRLLVPADPRDDADI